MGNQADFSIAPLIILIPLVGFLFQSFLGKFLVTRIGSSAGKKVCGAVAVLAVLIPFVIAVILIQRLASLPADSRSITVLGMQWIDLASFKASFDILLDPLSLTMTLIVTGVGCLIHLYATGYMAEDKDYPRFFTYMNLFIGQCKGGQQGVHRQSYRRLWVHAWHVLALLPDGQQ
jgi:NADH-quinone oxidoreductase subunit L